MRRRVIAHQGAGPFARHLLPREVAEAPLVTVAIMDGERRLRPAGERGEIVIRSSLVMALSGGPADHRG
jgi:hypothetical protein